MDNTYLPAEGSPDPWATRPIGNAVPGQQPPGRGPGPGPRGSGRLRWGLGIAAAAVLLFGGAAAGVALSGGGPAAGPTGQAAALNSVLSSASSPASPTADSALTTPQARPHAAAPRCRKAIARLRAAGRSRAARAVRRACRWHLLRGAGALAGIHGQFTFETRSGPRTLAYERGVVESASSAAVVVRAADGTTWTWDLVSDTVLREHGQRVTSSVLAAGQHVFAGGPVSGGSHDARLIVIRPASAAGAAS